MTDNFSKINVLYYIQTAVKSGNTDPIAFSPLLSVQSIEFERLAELDLTIDFTVFDAVIFRIEKLDDTIDEIIQQHLIPKKTIFYFIYNDLKSGILDKYQRNSNLIFLPQIHHSSPYIQLFLKLTNKCGFGNPDSENYFAEILKDLPFPFLIFGTRGRARKANKEFYKEFFYKKQDIAKLTLHDLLIGVSADTILKNAKVNQSFFPQTFSCSIIDGKGNLVPCEAHFIIHQTDDTPSLLLFIKNLSKLNQQEKIVDEHSISFQLVSQIIDLLSKREDIDFYDTSVNKKLLELFTADHLISIPMDEETGEMEFNHLQESDEALIPPIKSIILTALSAPRPSIFQIDPTRLADVKTTFRSVFIIPLLSGSKLFGIMIFFYLNRFEPSLLQIELAEIISRLFGSYLSKVLYLKKLQASENLFKTAVENAINGIYQSTPDGKILFVNEALLRMLGYDSLEEMQKLKVAEDLYLDPEERKKFIRELEKNKVITNCTVKLKRKDGSSIVAIENAYILHDAKGRAFFREVYATLVVTGNYNTI